MGSGCKPRDPAVREQLWAADGSAGCPRALGAATLSRVQAAQPGRWSHNPAQPTRQSSVKPRAPDGPAAGCQRSHGRPERQRSGLLEAVWPGQRGIRVRATQHGPTCSDLSQENKRRQQDQHTPGTVRLVREGRDHVGDLGGQRG